MIELTVTKAFEFDSAHHLPHYDGRCKNPHGHRWRLEVTVWGLMQNEGPKQGMIVDFVDLKKVVNEKVIDVLDHNDINGLIPNPTAENMIQWIAYQLNDLGSSPIVSCCQLRLWETPDSCVTWRVVK
jgi:6-pyruvoyltetrahydropterin/6-carboxytetrahydropterin synthase